MARMLDYTWPAANTQAVCLTQPATAAGALLINGTYSTPYITMGTVGVFATSQGMANFFANGFARQVTLTSGQDLAAVNYTITGSQNGVPVSEVLAGPNVNTVTSVNIYDAVTSIVASAGVAASTISAGTGLVGYFKLIGINTAKNQASVSYSIAFITQADEGCTYEIGISLSEVSNNGQTYTQLIANDLIQQLGDSYVNITQVLEFTIVCQDILVSVTSSDAASTMTLQFIQA